MKSNALVPGATSRSEKRGSRMVEETPPLDWPDIPCRCDVSFSAETNVDRLSPVAVNPLNLSRIAYGEFRSHAWRRDGKVPRGLADAVLSAGMACLRGNPCSPVDGSAATENNDKIAWETIRNATGGTDRSGGGDLMCVGNQMCRYVHSAFTWVGRQKTLVSRDEPLQTTGRVTISNAQRGSLTLYFYKLPFRGWLRREDLLGPPAGG